MYDSETASDNELQSKSLIIMCSKQYTFIHTIIIMLNLVQKPQKNKDNKNVKGNINSVYKRKQSRYFLFFFYFNYLNLYMFLFPSIIKEHGNL
jgi:hypothetical protein